VKRETIERVVKAAAAAGYRRNLLAGTVMSHQRRSCGVDFRGVIGVIDLFPASRAPCAQEFAHAVLVGIEERANAMGFKAERFVVGEGAMTLKRLDSILFIRGVQALVILPVAELPGSSDVTWHRYAAVYVDQFIDRPVLHSVCSDHYRCMIALLHETHHRGYRRPGLILEDSHDARLYFHWERAFRALQRSFPGVAEVPSLRVGSLNGGKFREWFKLYQPDVVLDQFGTALEWMQRTGAHVPETHGYVSLNSIRSPLGSARLDLRPVQIGARAAELVSAQLLHNKMGRPEQPSLTTLPAHFIEGCTLPSRNSKERKATFAQARTDV